MNPIYVIYIWENSKSGYIYKGWTHFLLQLPKLPNFICSRAENMSNFGVFEKYRVGLKSNATSADYNVFDWVKYGREREEVLQFQ